MPRCSCAAQRPPPRRPPARRLALGGGSLLHFSSFLALCTRLEELCLQCDQLEDEQAELLATHLWCAARVAGLCPDSSLHVPAWPLHPLHPGCP